MYLCILGHCYAYMLNLNSMHTRKRKFWNIYLRNTKFRQYRNKMNNRENMKFSTNIYLINNILALYVIVIYQ